MVSARYNTRATDADDCCPTTLWLDLSDAQLTMPLTIRLPPGRLLSDVQVGVGTTHAGEPLYDPARRRTDVVVTFGVGAGTGPIGSVAV